MILLGCECGESATLNILVSVLGNFWLMILIFFWSMSNVAGIGSNPCTDFAFDFAAKCMVAPMLDPTSITF